MGILVRVDHNLRRRRRARYEGQVRGRAALVEAEGEGVAEERGGVEVVVVDAGRAKARDEVVGRARWAVAEPRSVLVRRRDIWAGGCRVVEVAVDEEVQW